MAFQPRAQVRREHLTPHRIVVACRAGAQLTRCLGRRGEIFLLQPPGVRVESQHALAAIKSGVLTPADRGLFPGNIQSWKAWP